MFPENINKFRKKERYTKLCYHSYVLFRETQQGFDRGKIFYKADYKTNTLTVLSEDIMNDKIRIKTTNLKRFKELYSYED